MTKGKQIGDCPILVAECLAVSETTIMAIKKNLQRSIIQMTHVGFKFHQCQDMRPSGYHNLVEALRIYYLSLGMPM